MELRPYIEYLKVEDIEQAKGLELLRTDTNLTTQEKNLIFAYCYPRQLMDRELPSRVMNYRQTHGIPNAGQLTPSLEEATLILEAGQTEQYGRFIKHLMYAFCDPNKVFPVETEESHSPFDCCICGKPVYDKDVWNLQCSATDIKKEFQAFGSTESSVVLCIDCLTQLLTAYNLVNEFDPGFLDWTKRYKKSSDVTLTWGSVKLKK